MTKFILSFLLAFKKTFDTNKKQKKSKNSNKNTKKSNVNKAHKNDKFPRKRNTKVEKNVDNFECPSECEDLCETEKKQEKQFESFEESENLIESEIDNTAPSIRTVKSGNVSQCCHIEYTFIPNKFSYSADIIFCDPVAIIYADCGVQAQRVVNYGDVCWNLFTLTHEMNLSNEDIVTLHDSHITVTFTPDKKMLGRQAKLYKPTIYYLKPEHIEASVLFAPLYTADPFNAEPDSIEDYIKKLLSDTLRKRLDPNYIIHNILNQENCHKSKLLVFLKRINSNRDPAPYRAIIPNYFPEAVTREKTTAKFKSKTKSRRNKSCIDCSFAGEMIFTDHKEILLEVNSGLMLRSYALITVENLLTFEQRHFFNPLTISVSEIVNLPVEQLKKDGYEKIYIKYEVPGFGTIFTHLYPLKKSIKINEGRAFLTHECDKLILINFIQSDRIYMEVHGLRPIPQKQPSPCLFGNRYFDCDLNRPFNKRLKTLYQSTIEPTSETDHLLCIAPVPFVRPITTAWSYFYTQACYNENAIWRCVNLPLNYRRKTLNLNDINFSNQIVIPLREESVLEPQTLLDLNTCVNVTLALVAPLQLTLLTMLGTDLPFSRIVMVIYDENSAFKILALVHSYNLHLNNNDLPTKPWIDCVIVRSLCRGDDDFRVNYEEKEKSNRNLITGFFIDDGNKFIVYLEGLASGFLHVVWSKVMHWDKKIAQIWYNSDLVFKNRLYYSFLPCTAILTITLKKSLETLLILSMVSLKGSMPIPCWQAIRKLNFLLLKSSMHLLAKYQSFPSAYELLSLNIELGIPFQQSRFKPYPLIYNKLCMNDSEYEEMMKSQLDA